MQTMPAPPSHALESAAGPAIDLTPIARFAPGGGRVSDRVSAELSAAIRELRLPPGVSISGFEIAERLKVSRTPVREALDRLVSAGLVEVLPQVGTRVAPIRMRDVEEARFVREGLEVAALELACQAPRAERSSLAGLLDAQRAACDRHDYEAFFSLDESLHAGIFELGGHPGAWRVVQRSKLHLDRLRRMSLPEPATLAQLIDDHTQIINALTEGDAAAGSRCLRVHARRVLEHAPLLREHHPEYFDDS